MGLYFKFEFGIGYVGYKKIVSLIFIKIFRKKGRKFAQFKCICGNITKTRIDHWASGHTKSCGCLLKKHGASKTKTYRSWAKMKFRCRDINNHYYGGRGIAVCKRWEDFSNFLIDMGERPKGKTLDRINVNGNYSKSNCRWATKLEQANNTRNNKFIEFNGEIKTISQWAKCTNKTTCKLWKRIFEYKWSPKKAIETP